jgi:hypothetical protein
MDAGLIDDSQLKRALSDQVQWNRPLGVTLVKLGIVREQDILDVLSRQLDRPTVDVEGKRVADDVLELVPYEMALSRRCLPLAVVEKAGRADELLLGLSDPTDLELMDDIGFRTGMIVQPILVADGHLEEAIDINYRPRANHDELPLITPEQVLRPARPERAAAHPDPGSAPTPQQERELVLNDEAAPATKPAPPTAPARPVAPPAQPVAATPAPVQPQPPARPPARAAARPPARPTDADLDSEVLRALIDLLVDKGVIDPDELIDWLEPGKKRRES